MEAVEGVGGDLDGGEEAEGEFGAVEIVVDGLGYSDAGDSAGNEMGGAGHGSVAADADEAGEPGVADIAEDAVGDVFVSGLAVGSAADGIPAGIGLVAGAKDGSAGGEDVADIVPGERGHAVFDEAEEAVGDADDVAGVLADEGFGDGADDGIEPRAVAAAGEDADAWGLGHGVAPAAIIARRPRRTTQRLARGEGHG